MSLVKGVKTKCLSVIIGRIGDEEITFFVANALAFHLKLRRENQDIGKGSVTHLLIPSTFTTTILLTSK